jgi:hypothetical protein
MHGRAVRLRAASGIDRSRPGIEGHRGDHRRASVLLQEGIGDTIRASLTPLPNGDRTEEVIVSQQILQSLGMRSFTPQVTACPGCGRTTSTFFQDMADQIQTYLREQMPVWKARYAGVEEMKVAVMGCVVNGPGESKHANLGISLPGTFEEPVAPVYVDGKLQCTLRGDAIRRRVHRHSEQLRRVTAISKPSNAGAVAILSADPYNRSRNHKIKKLEGVQRGDAQYRLALGRSRFRYDILDQVVLLGYCGLRRESTY